MRNKIAVALLIVFVGGASTAVGYFGGEYLDTVNLMEQMTTIEEPTTEKATEPETTTEEATTQIIQVVDALQYIDNLQVLADKLGILEVMDESGADFGYSYDKMWKDDKILIVDLDGREREVYISINGRQDISVGGIKIADYANESIDVVMKNKGYYLADENENITRYAKLTDTEQMFISFTEEYGRITAIELRTDYIDNEYNPYVWEYLRYNYEDMINVLNEKMADNKQTYCDMVELRGYLPGLVVWHGEKKKGITLYYPDSDNVMQSIFAENGLKIGENGYFAVLSGDKKKTVEVVYQLSEGKLNVISENEYTTSGKKKYKWSGESVSKKEYDAKIKEYLGNNIKEYMHDSKVKFSNSIYDDYEGMAAEVVDAIGKEIAYIDNYHDSKDSYTFSMGKDWLEE